MNRHHNHLSAFFCFLGISIFNVSILNGEILSLTECVNIALSNKEIVKTAVLDVKSASFRKRGTYSNMLPKISVSGGQNIFRFPEQDWAIDPNTQEPILGTISRLTTITSGANIGITLYDGGQSWNQIAQADNNYFISTEFERQSRINVIWEVHQTFYQFLKHQQLYDVVQSSLDLAKQQVELVRNQYELGIVNKTDMLKAEVRLGQAKVDVINQLSAVYNARFGLQNAMGLADSSFQFTILEPESSTFHIPVREEIRSIIKSNSPSLRIYQAQITDAEMNYKLIRGTRLPVIKANISYTISSDDFSKLIEEKNDSWRLNSFLSISIPLFSGFDTFSKIQQAQIDIRIKQNEYSSRKNDLITLLEPSLTTLEDFKETIPIYENIMSSAEEDLVLVQERYRIGAATILELLDAQVSVTQTRSNLVISRYDEQILAANIQALLGTLDTNFY